jgi:succinate-semialdehyde dehydrogenase/glutarate-semialdehyde dehydrogenase
MAEQAPRERDGGELQGLLAAGAVPEEDREWVAVESPNTGDVVGRIPQAEPADVRAAFEAAREAQSSWDERPVKARKRAALELHDLLLAHQPELLDLMQLEGGKARRDAFEDLADGVANCRHYAFRASRYLTSERRKGGLPLLTSARVNRHPKGVVGMVTPWNYPLTLVVSDTIPALLAGNAVVCKPAEGTPFTALRAKQLFDEAGFPPDLFQVVTGRGGPVGETIVAESDHVAFTGSTAVGRKLAAMAGEHLVSTSMELGGENPMLVLDDADVERAARGAVGACFSNAGQLCVAMERIYVAESLYGEFLDAFVSEVEAIEVGTDYSFDVDMGPLASQAQLDKVRRHVEDAVERGATVETGGDPLPEVSPYAHEPTVLTDVPPDASAACEETFGPVVRVAPVPDEETAVERANDSEYGLNASVWTRDTDRGRDVARRIECGTVNVNDGYAASWLSLDAPMGGMKDSGLGRRHGREGFDRYTEPQTVAVQRLVPAAAPPEGTDFETHADRLRTALRWMKRIPGLR